MGPGMKRHNQNKSVLCNVKNTFRIVWLDQNYKQFLYSLAEIKIAMKLLGL